MKHTSFATLVVAVSAWFLIAADSQSQSPAPSATTMSATATLTAKIIAIDHDQRIVTIQDSKGNVQQLQVGPSVTRFDALKVGDTVTFRYEESIATSIVERGAAAPSAATSPTITRAPGEKPGGTVTQTVTTTVTVKSIDLSTPAVTVVTQDGRTVTLAVQDKKALAGVKVGDVVQITYTRAIMITVK